MLNDFNANWRLHVTEDPDLLRIRLEDPNVDSVSVQAVTADGLEPTTVTVRPRNLGWWALVEVKDVDSEQ